MTPRVESGISDEPAPNKVDTPKTVLMGSYDQAVIDIVPINLEDLLEPHPARCDARPQHVARLFFSLVVTLADSGGAI